jgi:small subunit ribosomal protein S16
LAVKIRLTRFGRKKSPFYRIVVTDSRTPRDGRYIECIGTYNPLSDPAETQLDQARIAYWLDQGAQPSDTVKSLFKHSGILFKRNLKKRGFDDVRTDEEMKKWEVLQIERKKRKSEKAQVSKKSKKKAAQEAKPQAAAAPEAAPAKAESETPVEEAKS